MAACAHCRDLNLECPASCLYRVYFPAAEPEKWDKLKDVFNLPYIARKISLENIQDRDAAVASLIYEAGVWAKNPNTGVLNEINIKAETVEKFAWDNEQLTQNFEQLTRDFERLNLEIGNLNLGIENRKNSVAEKEQTIIDLTREVLPIPENDGNNVVVPAVDAIHHAAGPVDDGNNEDPGIPADPENPAAAGIDLNLRLAGPVHHGNNEDPVIPADPAIPADPENPAGIDLNLRLAGP